MDGTRIILADTTPGMINAKDCDNLAEVQGDDWDEAFREPCQSKYLSALHSSHSVLFLIGGTSQQLESIRCLLRGHKSQLDFSAGEDDWTGLDWTGLDVQLRWALPAVGF